MITFKALHSHAKKRLDILEKTYSHLPLSPQDWEDLKQEVIIHIFLKRKQWQAGSGYKRWVNTIVRNQFLNILRNDHFVGKMGPRKSFDRDVIKFYKPLTDAIDPKTEFNNLNDCLADLDPHSSFVINRVIERGTIGKGKDYKEWIRACKVVKSSL